MAGVLKTFTLGGNEKPRRNSGGETPDSKLLPKDIDLLAGEMVLYKVNSVSVLNKGPYSEISRGELTVTNYQIIYTPLSNPVNRISGNESTTTSPSTIPPPPTTTTPIHRSPTPKTSPKHTPSTQVRIPLTMINFFTRKTVGNAQEQIKIKTYDMRLIKITISGNAQLGGNLKNFTNMDSRQPNTDSEGLHRSKSAAEHVYDYINRLVNLQNQHELFAFSHRLPPNTIEGWALFSSTSEYNRMGLPSPQWALTSANHDYSICLTYPAVLCVPNCITLDDIKKSAEFRSKGRIPVLCWKSPLSPATITRCSQPLVGRSFNRCPEDEKLVYMIYSNNGQTPTKEHLVVVDARPRVNAMANQAGSDGGWESAFNYKFCNVNFMGIGNIHIIRDSMTKLYELITSERGIKDNWLAGLDDTGWMKHLRSIIIAAVEVAISIEQGYSVMVHCSDGWDRTAQISSLAQLMLDPYYRTMKGFAVLIEKEWISFGHKFGERSGHFEGHKSNSLEKSPIFLQFLDSVSQLLRQFPSCFEFSQNFLVALADHVYSCRFGTFLFNTQKERSDIQDTLPSIWTWLFTYIDVFYNALYDERTFINHAGKGSKLKPIIPSTNLVELVFWKEFYLRHHQPADLSNYSRGSIMPRKNSALSNDGRKSVSNFGVGGHLEGIKRGNGIGGNLYQERPLKKENSVQKIENLKLSESFDDQISSGGYTHSWVGNRSWDIMQYAKLIPQEEKRVRVLMERVCDKMGTTSTFCSRWMWNGITLSLLENETPSENAKSEGNGEKSLISEISNDKTVASELGEGGVVNNASDEATLSDMENSREESGSDSDSESDLEASMEKSKKSFKYNNNNNNNNGNNNDNNNNGNVQNVDTNVNNNSTGFSLGSWFGSGKASLSFSSSTSTPHHEGPFDDSSRSFAAFSSSDIDRGELPHSPPVWILDSWSSHCASCGREFSRMRRKHHCRCCGEIFCSVCSQKKIPIPQYDYIDPVRVCDPCYAKVATSWPRE